MPQNPAGCRIEPPVSDPRLSVAIPAATDAAGPPELPPGTRVVTEGVQLLRPGAPLAFEGDRGAALPAPAGG